MDIKKIKEVFDEYVSNFNIKEKEIYMKYYHSYKVADLMRHLGLKMSLTKEEIDLCYLIGLLHDIGRFEQFSKYKSFNDSKTVDHADESCIYLFDKGHIREYIDTDTYDEIIYYAIKNHNKKIIDENIKDDKILFFCKLIRDADKIDIFRVSAIYNEYKFDANEVSMDVLESYKNNDVIDLKQRKSKSDAIILMLAFVFDINFNESFDLLADTDNFELYMSNIEVDKSSERLFTKIKTIAIDKVNKGV